MSQNRKPTHPGELIREDLLAEAGLSQNKLAQLIGVSPKTISDIALFKTHGLPVPARNPNPSIIHNERREVAP
jgi:hypothetical protein